MSMIVLDTNAVIMHGRAFADRVRDAVEDGRTIVLPQSVKTELVDDVLENEQAPSNHRASAQTIQELIVEEYLSVLAPDFASSSDMIDEARRRIAGDSLPEHKVKADQYIPALVCELAREGSVLLVTADQKLRGVVRDIAERQQVAERIAFHDPVTVL